MSPTTPYRTEVDALRERRETLASELADLRRRASELEALRAHEAALGAEIAAIEARLREGPAVKRALPLLDQVRVASPCNAAWTEMVGDERVRFCLSCEKNVYNLSAMTREDAEALLRRSTDGQLCVRFYQRADGTILTEDCPVGVKKKRRRRLAVAVAGAGAMAAAAMTLTAKQGGCPTRTMGQITMTPPVETAEAPAIMGSTAIPVAPPQAPTPPAAPTTRTPHVPKR